MTAAPGGTFANQLREIGWEVRVLDVDLVAGRLAAELRRDDGRWVSLVATADGGALIERWHRHAQGGDEFLGRTHAESACSGLRGLWTYATDNPAPGAHVRALETSPLSTGRARRARSRNHANAD